VVINLLFIGIMSYMIPNVSWEGHLGGAVGGALASFPLQMARYGDTWPRRLLGLVGTVLVGVAFVAIAVVRA
jgi:membrane associated rhomboid family serine protease